MNEDALLLRRYAEERSETAFAELVRRHLDLVYSAALRRTGGDPHRAADAAQQVFTRLARDARRLARHAVLTAWLYTATRNAAIDLLRTEVRRRAREQEAHVMHDLISEPVHDAEWQKLRPVLDGVMDELGETDRAVVLLRFFDRRSFAEVGAALNVSADAARMRTERALEKLRSLLARRGITSTAAALGAVIGGNAVVSAPTGLAGAIVSGALASAVGTAAWIAGAVEFMSTTKFAIGAAGLAGLLLVGASGYRLNAARNATESAEREIREHSGLVAWMKSVETSACAAEQDVVQLRQAVAEREAQAAAGAAAPKAPAWDPVAAGKQLQERHPHVARAFIDMIDATANHRYGPFFKERGWTDAQIAEFKFLQRSGWSMTLEIGGAKTLRFIPEGALPATEAEARRQMLLGPDEWRALLEWNRQGARINAHRLAAALCFSDAPLRPEQAEQLSASIVSAFKGPATALAFVHRGDNIDWDAVDARARQILSAEQLPAWNDILAVGRANRELYLAMEAVRQAKANK